MKQTLRSFVITRPTLYSPSHLTCSVSSLRLLRNRQSRGHLSSISGSHGDHQLEKGQKLLMAAVSHMDNIPVAKQLLAKALHLVEQSQSTLEAAKVLKSTASQFMSNNEYILAAQAFKKSLRLAEKSKDSDESRSLVRVILPDLIKSLMEVPNSNLEVQTYLELALGIPSADASTEHDTKKAGGKHSLIQPLTNAESGLLADLRLKLAECYLKQDKHTAAEQTLLVLKQETLAEEPTKAAARRLRAIGKLLMQVPKNEEALACLKKSNEWISSTEGKSNVQIMNNLQSIAEIYTKMSKTKEANQVLTQSIRLRVKLEGQVNTIDHLLFQITLSMHEGNHKMAKKLIERTLKLVEEKDKIEQKEDSGSGVDDEPQTEEEEMTTVAAVTYGTPGSTTAHEDVKAEKNTEEMKKEEERRKWRERIALELKEKWAVVEGMMGNQSKERKVLMGLIEKKKEVYGAESQEVAICTLRIVLSMLKFANKRKKKKHSTSDEKDDKEKEKDEKKESTISVWEEDDREEEKKWEETLDDQEILLNSAIQILERSLVLTKFSSPSPSPSPNTIDSTSIKH